DPIGLDGAGSSYVYSYNDPAALADPSGMYCVVCKWERHASDESLSDLGDAFVAYGPFGAVLNSAHAVFDEFFNNPAVYPGATWAKTAALIHDKSPFFPRERLRHPIIVFADVCFDDVADCK